MASIVERLDSEAARRARTSAFISGTMSCRASPGLGCQSSVRPFTAAPISGLSRANARGASRPVAVCGSSSKGEVTLLDYGAGNVRSVRNAIHKLGYTIKDVRSGH